MNIILIFSALLASSSMMLAMETTAHTDAIQKGPDISALFHEKMNERKKADYYKKFEEMKSMDQQNRQDLINIGQLFIRPDGNPSTRDQILTICFEILRNQKSRERKELALWKQIIEPFLHSLKSEAEAAKMSILVPKFSNMKASSEEFIDRANEILKQHEQHPTIRYDHIFRIIDGVKNAGLPDDNVGKLLSFMENHNLKNINVSLELASISPENWVEALPGIQARNKIHQARDNDFARGIRMRNLHQGVTPLMQLPEFRNMPPLDHTPK